MTLNKRKIKLLIKRFVDIIGSAVGLILLSPLFLIISISIKLSSPGPVFFKQERLGYKGEAFKIIKFRTMVVNAENMGDGIMLHDANDPRITRIGKFLRATSLDELPQLINVLMGSMSLVGPRPPVIYHPYDGYDNYPLWAKKRFEMKPGMTGLAQVLVRNEATWDERIEIDNKYVDKFSIPLDVKILLGTVREVSHSKTF